MTKFTIVEGLVEVKVYPTRGGMRRALRQNYGNDFTKTEAVVVPVTAYNFSKDRKERLPLVAEVFLHKQVTLPVLVHECIHVSTVIHRSKKWDFKIARNINSKEERFAYTMTYVIQEMMNIFKPATNTDDYNFSLDELGFWVRASRRKK